MRRGNIGMLQHAGSGGSNGMRCICSCTVVAIPIGKAEAICSQDYRIGACTRSCAGQ